MSLIYSYLNFVSQFTLYANQKEGNFLFYIAFHLKNKDIDGFKLNIHLLVTSTTPYFHGSSRPELFCKNSVLENVANFTEKRLYQSLFFNKAAWMRTAALLKKSFWHMCFLVSFGKFSITSVFIEHLCWLVLFSVTLFHATTLFPYPLKTTINLKFFWYFQGVQKDTSGIKLVYDL